MAGDLGLPRPCASAVGPGSTYLEAIDRAAAGRSGACDGIGACRTAGRTGERHRRVISSIARWFDKTRTTPRTQIPSSAGARGPSVRDSLRTLNRDPYLCLADEDLRLISVFDDLRYDRADLDILSGPMRNRVLSKLGPLGFRQVSGGVIENSCADVRILFPKFRALGASPFDAMRDLSLRPQDCIVLTPTQTVCQLITQYPTDAAVAAIKTLIARHPANLLRIADFLEKTEKHQAFAGAIGHLAYVQRQAVEAEPLRGRRALR